MTCASCVGRVERKLRKIPGVDPAVNLPLESARVIVPEGVSDEQIVETINNAGYTAHLKNGSRAGAGTDASASGGCGESVALVMLFLVCSWACTADGIRGKYPFQPS